MWSNAVWGNRPQEVIIGELPGCTEEIRYAQAWPAYHELAMGLFTFERKSVWESAWRLVERNKWEEGEPPHPLESALLKWLGDPDFLASEPIRIPAGWVGMESVLLPLIERNAFKIKCLGCNREYRPESLEIVPETHKLGTFHHILDCPEGHRLIAIETMHCD